MLEGGLSSAWLRTHGLFQTNVCVLLVGLDLELPDLVNKNMSIKKIWYIYTVEYCSAIRRIQITFSAPWMDLEIVILSGVSQTEKGNIIGYLFYAESKKK